MKYKLFKEKAKFSFSIFHINSNIKNKYIRTYLNSFLVLLIFILLLGPIFIYSHVLYKNEALYEYFKYYNEISELSNLPSKNSIFITHYLSLTIFALIFIFLLIFKPIIFMYNNYKYQNFVIWMLLLFIIISFSLSAASQSSYYNYQYLAEFISTDHKLEWQNEKIQNLSEWFEKNYDKWNYKWSSFSNVWWIMSLQILILFFFIIKLRYVAIYDNFNKEKNKIYFKNNIVKNNFIDSIMNYFSYSKKTISKWIFFITFFVLISYFYYAFLINDNNKIISVIYLNNIIPNLLKLVKDYNIIEKAFEDKLYINVYPLFFIVSVPVLCLIVTISTLISFLYNLNENSKKRIFYIEFTIIFLEIMVTLIACFISQIFLEKMVSAWNLYGKNYIEQINNLEDKDITEIFNIKPYVIDMFFTKKENIISFFVMTMIISIFSFLIIYYYIYKNDYKGINNVR